MIAPPTSLDASLLQLIHQLSVPVVLGLARIGACVTWLPYLSTGTVPSRLMRTSVAALILIGLWPAIGAKPDIVEGSFALLLAVLREGIVGTLIGLAIAFPFHAFHALGSIIDYQRGASISAVLNPVSGAEATEMANLLQMVCAMAFLATGGMLGILRALHNSYTLIPMGASWSLNVQELINYVPSLAADALRMSMPVIVLLLLVECLLGVLSRFAEQMNAFSMALALKSFVAFLGMLVYLMWTVSTDVPAMMNRWSGLQLLLPGSGT